ncbi:MAG: hypothetical protein WCF33_21650, partial [Pseudonocardiaceae bacterium]
VLQLSTLRFENAGTEFRRDRYRARARRNCGSAVCSRTGLDRRNEALDGTKQRKTAGQQFAASSGDSDASALLRDAQAGQFDVTMDVYASPSSATTREALRRSGEPRR